MSRRSRSQHPQKARPSETPSQEQPAAPATEIVESRSHEPETSAPVDDMAALDAGWDTPLS